MTPGMNENLQSHTDSQSSSVSLLSDLTLLFAMAKSSMLQTHLLNLLLTYLLQMAVQGPGYGWSQSCCQDVLFPIRSCLSLKYFLCSCMACSSKGTFIPSTQVNIRAFITGPSPGNISRNFLLIFSAYIERKTDRAARRQTERFPQAAYSSSWPNNHSPRTCRRPDWPHASTDASRRPGSRLIQ